MKDSFPKRVVDEWIRISDTSKFGAACLFPGLILAFVFTYFIHVFGVRPKQERGEVKEQGVKHG